MFRSLLSCRTYHELVSSASRRQKGLADVVRPCTTNLSGLAERTRSVIDTNATARRGFLSLATSPPSRTQIPSCHHLQSRYNNDSGVVAATAVVRRPHQQSKSAKRYLHLHEYQSLSLMKQAGLTTQNGGVARTPEEARIVAQRLLVASPNCDLIVKAQIHAGGRGKGHFTNGFKGGVQILRDPSDVENASRKMLGYNLITKQTTAEGQPCNALLINEGINITKEFYLAVLLDREAGGPVIVASSQGGMDIEEVASSNPSAILVEPFDINIGVTNDQAVKIARGLGLTASTSDDSDGLMDQAVKQIMAMCRMLIDRDATQIEVNPFALADDGKLYCVDAKLNFDDCADYRQKDVFAMRDMSMEDPRDVRAEESNLNYVGLDGSIGCMVNGAGLAMATMDLIQLSGGKPANFLDVGGGASKEQVSEAFKILTSDPNVKGLLVNIFGGIMKCDVIAQGIIAAHKEVGLSVPLVVRLEGTNVEAGKDLLNNSGLPIITADNLDDAAQKAVDAVKESSQSAVT